MKHGWMYLADEYDFAQPNVLSVYQAVLEGKPLYIKEADAANRVIKPHPNSVLLQQVTRTVQVMKLVFIRVLTYRTQRTTTVLAQ